MTPSREVDHGLQESKECGSQRSDDPLAAASTYPRGRGWVRPVIPPGDPTRASSCACSTGSGSRAMVRASGCRPPPSGSWLFSPCTTGHFFGFSLRDRSGSTRTRSAPARTFAPPSGGCGSPATRRGGDRDARRLARTVVVDVHEFVLAARRVLDGSDDVDGAHRRAEARRRPCRTGTTSGSSSSGSGCVSCASTRSRRPPSGLSPRTGPPTPSTLRSPRSAGSRSASGCTCS